MASCNWVYIEDKGVTHSIYLFHGERDGHVLCTCNNRILFIDFGIKESKNYTFFINQAMCEVQIKRKGSVFTYGFVIDDKADTPLNRYKKKVGKKHLFQSIAFFTIIIILSIAFSEGMKSLKDRMAKEKYTKYINVEKTKSTAYVYKVSPEDQTIEYTYMYNGELYNGSTQSQTLNGDHQLMIEEGMTLEVEIDPLAPEKANLLPIYHQ